MNNKALASGIVIIMAILGALASCTNSPEPNPVPPLQVKELPVTEDGLIEVNIPEILLGGKTAEEFYNSYSANTEYQDLVTGLIVNNDGSITMLLSPKKLEEYKQRIYYYSQFDKSFDVTSIKEVIYHDEYLVKITVLVDSSFYAQNGFEKQMCNSLLAANAGMYQVMSGVPPDEWRTTITIKDSLTSEIVSENEFPCKDMYRVY